MIDYVIETFGEFVDAARAGHVRGGDVVGLGMDGIETIDPALRNELPDCQGRRRPGRRRVHDVERALGLHEQEVVDEAAVGGEDLGADPAWPERYVARLDLRQIPLHVGDECALEDVSPELGGARSGVCTCESPEAGKAKRLHEITRFTSLRR